MNYALGFLFRLTVTGLQVALIRKNRPPFQAGKLNGIGGKQEPGETTLLETMVREFEQETGCALPAKLWRSFGEMRHGSAHIQLFVAYDFEIGVQLRSVTDEQVSWYDVAAVAHMSDVMPQLKWMIPLALDSEYPYSEITYPNVSS